MDVIANNAMGTEMGNISRTNAAISTAGGVDGFSNLQAAESSVRTAESKGATVSKIAEALRHDNKNLSDEQAKKMAQAIVEGSQKGADKFKEALSSLGELQGNTMSMKTAKDFQTVDAAKRNGILDSNGNVTDLGRENYFNAASQDFARSAEMLKQTDDPVKNEKWVKALEDKGINMSDFRDPVTGKALTGQAMRDAIARNQAMLFSHGKGIVGADGKVFTGTVIDGHAQGKVSGGLSSSVDNTDIEKFGNSTQILTQGKFKSQVEAFKVANGRGPHSMKELAQWVEKSDLAEESKNSFFGNLVNTIATRLGVSPESAEVGAYMAGMGVGGWMLNKTFGDPVGKTVGSIRKGVNKVSDKLGFTSPSDDINDPHNKTQHNSTSHHNNEPGNSHGNQSAHDNSFHSNSTSNSTKSTENVKGTKGFSGKNTTESGIILPDNPKEPIPHVNAGAVRTVSREAETALKAAKTIEDAAKAVEWMALADAPYYNMKSGSFRTARAVAALNQVFDAGTKGILATGEEFIGKTLGVDALFGTHLSKAAAATLSSAGKDIGNAFNNISHLFSSDNRVYGYEDEAPSATGQNNSVNTNLNADGTPPALKVVNGKLVAYFRVRV